MNTYCLAKSLAFVVEFELTSIVFSTAFITLTVVLVPGSAGVFVVFGVTKLPTFLVLSLNLNELSKSNTLVSPSVIVAFVVSRVIASTSDELAPVSLSVPYENPDNPAAADIVRTFLLLPLVVTVAFTASLTLRGASPAITLLLTESNFAIPASDPAATSTNIFSEAFIWSACFCISSALNEAAGTSALAP